MFQNFLTQALLFFINVKMACADECCELTLDCVLGFNGKITKLKLLLLEGIKRYFF